MDRNNPLDDFASLLGDIQPTAPDISPGSVMFEAGRKLGSTEALAFRSRSLRLWRAAAACSLVLAIASVSIWLVPREGDNIVVRDELPNREAEIINESTLAPNDSLASQTPQRDDTAVADSTRTQLAQAFFVADQSPLAQRQQMLRQGVGGLPEIATNQIWPVMTSSGRGELMNQLLKNESL